MGGKNVYEPTKIIRNMKALGLEHVDPMRRCRLCRGKTEWLAMDDLYCFACVIDKRVSVHYQYGPYIGRLSAEMDENQPYLYISEPDNHMVTIASQGHQVWDGCVIHKTHFVSIEPATPVVTIPGKEFAWVQSQIEKVKSASVSLQPSSVNSPA